MRIAFVDYVCDPARPGRTGLSDLVWDMASRLARLGDDVHVVAPYTVPTVPEPAVVVHRVPLPPIGYRNIAGHLLIIRRAARVVRALGPLDVVHVPEYLSAAVLSAALPQARVVLTEPGNVYERVRHGNPYDPLVTAVYKLAARRAARRCARLVATSDEMARWWLATGFSADRIVRVPLGIDRRHFRRVLDAQARLRMAPTERPILFAARLSRENGADLALEALARVRRRHGDAHLHILGDGPERGRLVRLSRRPGIADAVTWHGWVDFLALPVHYSAADVFVFPGYSGGTPRVLLQAMACGAPVVASAIGGIVDHVAHRQNGLLIPPGSSRALAEGICSLLDRPDEATRLGHEAARYAHTAVDWDVLVRRIREEVYAPLVEARAVPDGRGGRRADATDRTRRGRGGRTSAPAPADAANPGPAWSMRTASRAAAHRSAPSAAGGTPRPSSRPAPDAAPC